MDYIHTWRCIRFFFEKKSKNWMGYLEDVNINQTWIAFEWWCDILFLYSKILWIKLRPTLPSSYTHTCMFYAWLYFFIIIAHHGSDNHLKPTCIRIISWSFKWGQLRRLYFYVCVHLNFFFTSKTLMINDVVLRNWFH